MTEEVDILGFDPRTLLEQNETNNSSAGGNSLIYHTRPAESKSEDGVYRSTIRVIYSPQDLKHSILEQQSYYLTDKDGGFLVTSSLTTGDKSCPIFNAWKRCRYAIDKDGTFKNDMDKVLYNQALTKEKGGRGLFDKRYARYVTIQVIKDINHPELEGQYLFWKLPKSIKEMIDKKMYPSAESGRAPLPIMDFLFGYAIDLEVSPGPDDPAHPERKTRETSYSGEFSDEPVSCTAPDGKSLLTPDEQEVLDTYISDMTKNVWKNKNTEDRNAKFAEIRANDNTKKLGVIYKNVLEKIKSFCPDLNNELGYKPWTDAIKTRVQNWINIVLSGNDPATYVDMTNTSAQAPTSTAAQPETQSSTISVTQPTQPATDTAADDSDLPF